MTDPRSNPVGERFNLQADLYEFPYHWLPQDSAGVWHIGRDLPWGFEYLAVVQNVVAEAVLPQPARVLDFGCGDGRLTHELLRQGVAAVVGIDLVERAILFARAFNSAYQDRCSFLCGDIQNLDEGQFDVIVAMETLEHIPDSNMHAVLDALWKRLVPEGRFVISVPTTNIPLNPKHERHYSLEDLRDQLDPFFEVAEVKYVHRVGAQDALIRRLIINRLFRLESRVVRRQVTRYYLKRLSIGDASNAGHLVARCRKRARRSD